MHLPTLLRDCLPPGTRLQGGQYQIDYALGQGGFGITYRGIHTHLEKLVAIKEYFPQEKAFRDARGSITIPRPQVEDFNKGKARFLKEGKLLAKINHPRVVRVEHYFEERETVYLVMELVAGKTLKKYLEEKKSLSEKEIENMMAQGVAGLGAAHRQGIYHLDLKPDNLMIDPEGKVKIVDFGAAKQSLATRAGSRRSTTRMFTEAYTAPEVMGLRAIGSFSDIFEMGMILHEMVTGKLPPSALERLLVEKDWQPTGIGEPWLGLIRAALPMEPTERAQEIEGWWESRQHGKRTATPSPAPVPPPGDDLRSERGVDYTRLQRLLQQQKWKDADEETYRRMLEAAKREKEEWFRDADLKNFPRTDLRTIDQLWVKYSKGRFGFSVQKQIWLDLGGKLGEYDYDTFKKLGDRVGWRKNGSWLNYSDYTFTFTTNALHGHLPAGRKAGRRWWGCDEVLGYSFLFSRL